MLWLWNVLPLMSCGKRNLFLLDCTSDSWQTTLSLCFCEAETKSRTGFLSNLFKLARYVADACFHRCDNRTSGRQNGRVYRSNPCQKLVLPLICFRTARIQVKVAVICDRLCCPLELRSSHAWLLVALGPGHVNSFCGNTQVIRVEQQAAGCFHRGMSRFVSRGVLILKFHTSKSANVT